MASLASIHRAGSSKLSPTQIKARIPTLQPSSFIPTNPRSFKLLCTFAALPNKTSRRIPRGNNNFSKPSIKRTPKTPDEICPPNLNPESPPPNVDLMCLCSEGKITESLEFMSQGVSADRATFEMLLDSCKNSKSLELGKKVHQFLIRSPFNGDVELSHKLIEMYVNCGGMRDARRIFDRMRERNMWLWHLMIYGYANNGQGDDGLLLRK